MIERTNVDYDAEELLDEYELAYAELKRAHARLSCEHEKVKLKLEHARTAILNDDAIANFKPKERKVIDWA